MKTRTPSGPVSKRTPTMNPTIMIGMISAHATATSAAMWPSRIAKRRTGCEQQPVEVAVLDVEHERRGSRHAGDAEQDRRRQLEGREVEARDLALGEARQRPDVDEEEEQGDEDRRDHRFEVAWDGAQRPAGDRRRVGQEPGRARFDWPRRSQGGCGRWSSTPTSSRRSSCRMRLPVSSRNTSSSVGVRNVRSRTRTSHALKATATGLTVADRRWSTRRARARVPRPTARPGRARAPGTVRRRRRRCAR